MTKKAQLCLHLCMCACVCVFTLNAFWSYVTLCSTCVWERDAAVVCDVFDSTHRAAHLHLFMTQHIDTHTYTRRDAYKIHGL